MSRLRSLLQPRILIAVVSLAVGITAFVASYAVVFPGPYVCSYYSGPNYKTVVGARGTGCCGSVINWGITTQWKKCQTLYCTDQICPN